MAILQDGRGHIRRIGWIGRCFSILILVLFCRLWYLSVVRFDHFQALANRNQIRSVALVAPRGEVSDREGTILVENTFGFDLLLFPDQLEHPERTRLYLAQAIDFPPDEFDERLSTGRTYGRYQPVVLKQNLSLAQMSFLLARASDHPELEILERPRRSYVYGNLAAHLVGYVGEISGAELAREAFQGRRPGDIVGKSGIEQIYDADLTGENGVQPLRVDSRGRTVELLTPTPARPGHPIRLTIDLDVQRAAEEALEGKVGAAIALDPRNGEILAIASRPTYDPNDFATRISRTKWQQLISNVDKPLQNRVIQSTFSPGSIFKIVLALAGLEIAHIDPRRKIFCAGSKEFFGHRFGCAAASGHGWLDLKRALQYSCNIYFYELGKSLGIDKIEAFSRRMGLGTVTGVDLNGEVAGLVPSRAWKKRTTGMPWFAGETISVSIGQGPVLVTPLQLAGVMAAVATGRAVHPHLRLSPADELSSTPAIPFSLDHLEPIREGMWLAVNDFGTARAARIEGLDVAGKTGTVQTISRAALEKLSPEQAKKFSPNAWFAGFAPAEDPRIVVAVILERGGSGGRTAALAHSILQAYQRKYLEADDAPTLLAGVLENRDGP